MVSNSDEPPAEHEEHEDQHSDAANQSELHLKLLFFHFRFRFFLAVGLRNDGLFLFPFRGDRLRFGRLGGDLLFDRLFDDHSAAAAMRRDRRGFFRIALIGAALRAKRHWFSEVIELGVATVAGVLPSEIWHVVNGSPGAKSGDTLAPTT